MSRSKVILLIKFRIFNIGHNYLLSPHTLFIFDIHINLKEQHILAPSFSRSRTHVKVKGHFIKIDSIVHNLTATGPTTSIFDNAYDLMPYFEPCDLNFDVYDLKVNNLNIVHCFSPHAHTNFIFGMFLCISATHFGTSIVKVKVIFLGQSHFNEKNMLQIGCHWGHLCFTNTSCSFEY